MNFIKSYNNINVHIYKMTFSFNIKDYKNDYILKIYRLDMDGLNVFV